MRRLVWKTNSSNPYDRMHVPLAAYGEISLDALQREREFWGRFVKGRPKETESCTVEQLEKKGMHGLYALEED